MIEGRDEMPGSEADRPEGSHSSEDLERIRAETQARLAAIVESSDDAIVGKDLNGVITSWNKGAERVFGWTAAEVIGKSITIIIPTERLDEEPRILAQIRSGNRVDHFETVRQTKDGRRIDISVTISPIRDHTGRVVGVSKVARDITLQKRFENELKAARDAAEKAREAAEAASRAKDHFLSILSHELRTPLTPALAAISMIERDPTLPPHVIEQAEMIRRNVETEARLVDDLLDLTRIARGKLELHFEVVDAHAVLRDVIAMFQNHIDEKRLTITAALHAARHHVWADPGRFQQMLLNLLSNAIKFTPDFGSITCRTTNENGTIRIDVADTGIGIEPEVMPKLFQPFEQGEQGVSRRFGGLGLGLSIIKSLVEMHGASISASSEGRDRGATFTLRIKSVREASPRGPINSNDAPDAQPRRILLVEDHDDTRRILSRLLTSFGCIVTTAGGVREAIEAAERQDFDLLVSDIGLPDGSGVDLMKHLARRSKVKGIALSGFGQDQDVRRSKDAGFTAHLTKPVNIQALQEAIRTLTR